MEIKEAVDGVLREWDILPSSRKFTLAEVSDWLIRFMGPAMERMREARNKD